MHPSTAYLKGKEKHHEQDGVGGEDGIRTHGSDESPVFKTGSLNHSDTSPGLAGFFDSQTSKASTHKFNPQPLDELFLDPQG